MARACASTDCGGDGSLTMAGLPGRMTCAFSRPMRLAIGAEKFHVVEVDAGDDGAVGVDGIDGVVAAAETDFENDHVQRLVRPAVARSPAS